MGSLKVRHQRLLVLFHSHKPVFSREGEAVLENAKAETLASYFVALNERLDNILPARFSVLAHIAGYTVRLIFPNMEYARYAVPDMFVRFDSGTETVDATFIWWEDRIFPYQPYEFSHLKNFEHIVNVGHKGYDIFKAEDSYGYVEVLGDALRAENYQEDKYYLMSHPSIYPKWLIVCHPFERAIFSWAQKHNLLMLHAAAIGVDGHGVLVVGHGGTGKSTLTCSCLVDGYDFISDDLCLLSAIGPRTVYPIYTNVFLKSDSLIKLPMFRPFEIFPQQGEKSSFVVGETRISSSLSVEAVILPQVTDNTEPDIKLDESRKGLAQLVYSTTVQLGRFQETEFVRKLSQRLLGMPVYRFSLTKDLQKNCQYLKKWIREELTCTN